MLSLEAFKAFSTCLTSTVYFASLDKTCVPTLGEDRPDEPQICLTASKAVINTRRLTLTNSYIFKDRFTQSARSGGVRTNKQQTTLAVSIIAVLAVVGGLEALALPFLYKGIPVPYPGGTKPIGGVLFVATFFHLLLITSSAIVVLLVARRLDLRAGEFLPKSRGGWIDLFFLMLLLISGLATWFNPLALILFIISGIYLIATELE